jgi:hypothetical protein
VRLGTVLLGSAPCHPFVEAGSAVLEPGLPRSLEACFWKDIGPLQTLVRDAALWLIDAGVWTGSVTWRGVRAADRASWQSSAMLVGDDIRSQALRALASMFIVGLPPAAAEVPGSSGDPRMEAIDEVLFAARIMHRVSATSVADGPTGIG